MLCGPMHLCVCVSEKFGDEEGVGCDNVERERGVGVDVNDTMLLMVGTDLLDGVTDTPEVSQRSEAGQRILCTKEDIGKYDMWYGVRQLHNL